MFFRLFGMPKHIRSRGTMVGSLVEIGEFLSSGGDEPTPDARVYIVEILVSGDRDVVRQVVEDAIRPYVEQGVAHLVPHDPVRERGRDCLTHAEVQKLRR